jgi:predicted Fe-S protein YdhL (DUF1289 family)
MTKRVKSPCISVCVLNDADVCTGCYRHSSEIVDWLVFNEEEKREVLVRCGQRRKDSGRLIL